MPTYADALALATVAHSGQTYGQVPYINHPIAVAALIAKSHGPSHELVQAALLHDAVEDTFVTLPILAAEGYSDFVIDTVDAVTRRGGEDYMDFVRRAASRIGGRYVKLADNTHNLSTLPSGDHRERRYVRERAILVEANGGIDLWRDLVEDRL